MKKENKIFSEPITLNSFPKDANYEGIDSMRIEKKEGPSPVGEEGPNFDKEYWSPTITCPLAKLAGIKGCPKCSFYFYFPLTTRNKPLDKDAMCIFQIMRYEMFRSRTILEAIMKNTRRNDGRKSYRLYDKRIRGDGEARKESGNRSI